MSDREFVPESESPSESGSRSGADPGSDLEFGAGADAGSHQDSVAVPGEDQAYRMPFAVRAAQVLAVGLAVIGLGCAVAAGWLSGSHEALVTGASFVASWLLGLVALTFGAEGGGIRVTAVLLAILNALWTVPSIIVGRPPGWLGPAVSILVVGLLLRRSARDWFEP